MAPVQRCDELVDRGVGPGPNSVRGATFLPTGNTGPYIRNVRTRRPGIPVQAPLVTSQDDAEVAGERYSCSTCRITYFVPRRSKAQCPLCDSRRRIIELQSAMTALRNQLEMTSDAATSLQTAVDIQVAMRHALEVIDVNDLTFLKSLLYRYRDDRTSISLAVMLGPARVPGGPPAPIGFQALPRNGEPELHACTSVGGVALAGYYQEVMRQAGSADALIVLIRALNTCLAAGART